LRLQKCAPINYWTNNYLAWLCKKWNDDWLIQTTKIARRSEREPLSGIYVEIFSFFSWMRHRNKESERIRHELNLTAKMDSISHENRNMCFWLLKLLMFHFFITIHPLSLAHSRSLGHTTSNAHKTIIFYSTFFLLYSQKSRNHVLLNMTH
jgi:hypothetical protein